MTIRNTYTIIKAKLGTMLSSTFWDSNLAGALIGAGAALLVVIVQNWQQQHKESETERNKLVYLVFLLDDTYNAIEWYDVNGQKVRQSIHANPFIIPDFPLYPIHSLEAIVNKINQEDYYLAFVSQMKDESLTKLLLMCNTMYRQYNDGTGHYKKEFQPLIQEKDKYRAMLSGLVESLNQYYRSKGEGQRLTGDEATMYRGLVSLSDSVKRLHVIDQGGDYNKMLYDSRAILLQPMIDLLDSKNEPTYVALLNQAREADQQYGRYVAKINNVADVVERNRVAMNDLVAKSKVLLKPLKEYLGK